MKGREKSRASFSNRGAMGQTKPGGGGLNLAGIRAAPAFAPLKFDIAYQNR
jgi:hypothetical protein